MDLALWKKRIISRKIWKILEKTLKMDEHILKYIHILKLNILGCDKLEAVLALELCERNRATVVQQELVAARSALNIEQLALGAEWAACVGFYPAAHRGVYPRW
jgi:hypothetical protein